MDESSAAGHESLTQEGIVVAQLPSGLYRVDIDGSVTITAHVGGGLERNFVRLLVGDRVVVELTARDRTRGRISRKA
ncbi:MAG: translation initiation factor IF-1 [Acidobacteria bacterium]|nr:translation initiation factor IF-1 [Acidobacteriota bacterium]